MVAEIDDHFHRTVRQELFLAVARHVIFINPQQFDERTERRSGHEDFANHEGGLCSNLRAPTSTVGPIDHREFGPSVVCFSLHDHQKGSIRACNSPSTGGAWDPGKASRRHAMAEFAPQLHPEPFLIYMNMARGIRMKYPSGWEKQEQSG